MSGLHCPHVACEMREDSQYYLVSLHVTAVTATGLIWSRYSTVITPVCQHPPLSN
jgi:hypothetical protein